MIEKMLSFFSRSARVPSSVAPKQWINNALRASGLDQRFPPEIRHTTQRTARVYYNQHYFPPSDIDTPFSLQRILTKTPAICLNGDKHGVFSNGLPFPDDFSFFSQISTAHPELLSPKERLSGAKKVVFSKSSVFKSGGYPQIHSEQLYKEPISVGMFSLAAATFENTYLHYSLFMLDPINNVINNPQFDHLYADQIVDFKEAQTQLGSYDCSPSLLRIRTGLPYLVRSSAVDFRSSFFNTKGVIFLSDAYFKHQLEDISLLLTAVNEAAKESGKPALLKATAAGMGFFAKINGTYDIQHILYPYYLRAYKTLLNEHSYPWIAKIEFPTFTEQQEEQFSSIMDKRHGNVEISQSSRDVLEFKEEESENYFISVVNPSDCFSYVGNEWGYGSVESMIGLNSSLRLDQVPLINEGVLNPENHIAVRVDGKGFGAEIVDSTPNEPKASPKV